MKWWVKAADSGSTTALTNVATAYYTGLGVRQSYPEAAKWFHLAANNGDADAMNMLGLMYAQGLGVTRAGVTQSSCLSSLLISGTTQE
jgi:TPR repeat protein